MSLWWKCPRCKEKVDFIQEMSGVFDEDGEAEFCSSAGLFFHTVFCGCGNNWTISISGSSLKEEIDWTQN